MRNPNLSQRGIKMIDLTVMIGKCSLHSQHGSLVKQPAKVGNSYFRYTKTKAKTHLLDTKGKFKQEKSIKSYQLLF